MPEAVFHAAADTVLQGLTAARPDDVEHGGALLPLAVAEQSGDARVAGCPLEVQDPGGVQRFVAAGCEGPPHLGLCPRFSPGVMAVRPPGGGELVLKGLHVLPP